MYCTKSAGYPGLRGARGHRDGHRRAYSAIQTHHPIEIFGKMHWPTGWLHSLTDVDDASPPNCATDEVTALRDALTMVYDEVVAEPFAASEYTVADVTRGLTHMVKTWFCSGETSGENRRWTVYREISVPITPGASKRFGRIDLIIMQADRPDLVIKIDSTNKPSSLEKLRFDGRPFTESFALTVTRCSARVRCRGRWDMPRSSSARGPAAGTVIGVRDLQVALAPEPAALVAMVSAIAQDQWPATAPGRTMFFRRHDPVEAAAGDSAADGSALRTGQVVLSRPGVTAV